MKVPENLLTEMDKQVNELRHIIDQNAAIASVAQLDLNRRLFNVAAMLARSVRVLSGPDA